MIVKQIDIWEPRYKDNVCLIAAHKVGEYNEIRFTKAKHLKGNVYKLRGDTITKYPLDTNGKIDCYAIPMKDMEDYRAKSIKLMSMPKAEPSYSNIPVDFQQKDARDEL